MIASVNPEVPEVARFTWSQPRDADGGATMLTVVESADDKLDESIRSENKRVIEEIVPGSRHIALRNTKLVPFKLGGGDPPPIPIDFPPVPGRPPRGIQ